MELKDEVLLNEDVQSKQQNVKPNAWRIEDENNLREENLEINLNGSNTVKPVQEGTPMGGHNFGGNNKTSAANDKNNPSQYAGNTNAYFDRTEPSDEHPENSNFKDQNQQGSPDYSKAQPTSAAEEPKPEKVERGNGENDRPHKGDNDQQGTTDDDAPNIPGPGELPDQQKVGEDVDLDDKDHIET
jgi:hypothetical protein